MLQCCCVPQAVAVRSKKNRKDRLWSTVCASRGSGCRPRVHESTWSTSRKDTWWAKLVVRTPKWSFTAPPPPSSRRARWAANKRFKILKFKFKFPIARTFELFRARSRLYRSQILQVNIRWKALVEIFTIHFFAPWSYLVLSFKIAESFADFLNIFQMLSEFCWISAKFWPNCFGIFPKCSI